MSINPHFKWMVSLEIALQICLCYFVKDCHWLILLVLAYTVGGKCCMESACYDKDSGTYPTMLALP